MALWQYLSSADKSIQIMRSVFIDKGTQPELRHNKNEITLLIRISDLPCAWLSGVQFSEIFDIASHYVHTQPGFGVLKT